MKSNYSNEHARCNVTTSNALPAGTMEVSSVKTDAAYQLQGYATKLMQTVCRDADYEGVVLVLMPLVHSFYERFDFKKIQNDPIIMARAPVTKKVKAHG
jgi:predicted N-acetyltransferase YhbS